jgi:tetratricopeptide (TPR) repeat protein
MAKSGILKQQGNAAEAQKIEKEALVIGTEAELNAYGYQLINQGMQEEAIQIFIVNTERYPASANTWDSLGEAYALKGDKENAIKNFKKSLSLNPSAATKANSEKYLKKLGDMK